MENQIIILGGGKGTRMKSDRPKVLTKIKGRSIIARQLKVLAKIPAETIIIVGYKGEEVKKAAGNKYRYVWQKEQLGTGHALMRAKKEIGNEKNIKNIIVIPGDHPLVSPKTIINLIKMQNKNKSTITMATVVVENFFGQNSVFSGYGRVIRNKKGEVIDIIELKDADERQKEIKELNVSYYCFYAPWLWENIEALNNKNKSNEYYLTDMIKIAVAQKLKIKAFPIENIYEGMGVNTFEQLKQIEKYIK